MSITQEELDNRVDLFDYDPILDDPSSQDSDIRRFDPFDDDLSEVRAADPNHVWTCVDCDECERCADERQPDCDCEPLRIIAGFHYVNREYYIITKKPWTTGNEWD